MSKTSYEVGVKYTMDDRASNGLKSMGAHADRTGRSVFSLQRAMVGIGVAAGALAIGKKLLIDYNSEMDSMRIGLTAVIQMQMHKPYEQARREAEGLFTAMQKVAKASPGTTKDFVEMATAIAPAVAAAGGDVAKIEILAGGAVIAGKAMGIRADVAALDIKQMLAGTVTSRDILAQQMLGAKGTDSTKFNALTARERGAFVEKALTDPALKRAAKTYGESFEGQMSTAMDNFQIGMAKIGKPLMGEVSKVLGDANAWIEKNPRLIAEFSKKFGEGIKDAFNGIKGIFSWLVDNRETLLTIGKMFIAFKAANLVTSEIGRISKGMQTFATALDEPGKLLKPFGLGLAGVVSGLALFAVGLQGLADHMLSMQTKSLDIEANRLITRMSLADAGRGILGAGSAAKNADGTFTDADTITRRNYTRAKDMGMLSPSGGMKSDSEYGSYSQEYLQLLKETVAEMHSMRMESAARADTADSVAASYWRQTMGGWDAGVGAGDPAFKSGVSSSDWAGAPSPANVNVTIQRIEVASEDPDRFVFAAVKAFEDIGKNPTQAVDVISGAF